MGDKMYPCIIYQGLRPSALEAVQDFNKDIWALADLIVEREGYSVCGLYGDSEYAPPFCGGSEIRPGYGAAITRARKIAAKLGTCTVIVGNAGPIGDGDPFLPTYEPPELNGGVKVRLINFHLRPHVASTSLCSAWRYFARYRESEHARATGNLIKLSRGSTEVKIIIQQDPNRLLARLYLANPTSADLTAEWKQLLRWHHTQRDEF